MKRRVALISSCAPPGPGCPVTGGGLRTEQLAQTLRAAGHSVRLFVEREALSPKAPKILREHSFDSNSLAKQVRSFRPSVLVVEQWALVPLIAELDKPLVIDLHGSLLLENVFRRGDVDLVLDAGSKIQALARADLLLVPAEVQVHHFASWATLAGFDPRELPIAVMPLAMADEPKPRKTKKPPLRVVYGGARWPWIDSLSALRTAADVIASIPDARLDVFTFEPPRHGLDFEEDLGTWPQVLAELAGREEQGVTLHDGQSHSSWQSFVRKEATVALDLWEPNPERMLAATTRSVEFLWAGLGLVTVTGSAWSESLARTGAGWSLAPGDEASLRDLLQGLAAQPGKIAAASRAATTLIQQEHQLLEAGRHLLRFCQEPTRPTRSSQTLSEALVVIREEHLAEELHSLKTAHEKEHLELIAAHREEQREDRDRHEGEVDALSERHREQIDALVTQHRRENDRDRERNSDEVQRLTTEHREEISTLVRDNHSNISRLETQHQHKMQELVGESRSRLEEAARRASGEAKSAAKEHRAMMMAATKDHRAQLKTQAKEHRDESKELVSQWRARLKELESKLTNQQQTHESELRVLADEHHTELHDVVTAHRSQVTALTEQHSAQSEQQAAEHNSTMTARDKRAREELEQAVLDHRAELKHQAAEHNSTVTARDKRAREELEQAVLDHRDEIESLADGNRRQVKELAAERQDEVQKLVGQSRAELEQADERHRAETQARIDEMQQRHDELQQAIEVLKEQLASERRRVKEERTRLEVELRAEMSARELELQQQMVNREAELGELLDRANRSLAEKVRARLASPGGGPFAASRLAPAARLARLWTEHAVDHAQDEQEE